MCELCETIRRKNLEKNIEALSLISSKEHLVKLGDSALAETKLEYSNHAEELLRESAEAEKIRAVMHVLAKKRKSKKDKELLESLDLLEAQTDCDSDAMERVGAAGRRLLQNPTDEYALASAVRAILNKVYLAENAGNNHYRKYFPKDTKKGNIKEVSFKSSFLCGWESQGFIPIFMTDSGRAFFGGLQRCGKVWSCPVCGQKINVRRNREIQKILEKALQDKHANIMLTLTGPHSKRDSVLSRSEGMARALYYLQNSRAWKDHLQKHFKCIGGIRCMETKIGGDNGAHNHFHYFLIFDCEVTDEVLAKMKDIILEEWEKSCVKSKILNPKNSEQVEKFRSESVDLKKNFSNNYLTKQSSRWRKELREVTFPRLEGKKYKADKNGLTPFGFVADLAIRVALGLVSPKEFNKACELFIEYSCAMYGRRQIVFSKGLRSWAGLYEDKDGQGMTDEQICALETAHARVIGGFDRRQSRFVRKRLAWKTVKKAIEVEGEAALAGPISEWFMKHGLDKVYSKEEAKLYVEVSDGVYKEDEEFDLVAFLDLMEKLLDNNREDETLANEAAEGKPPLDSVRLKKKAAGG